MDICGIRRVAKLSEWQQRISECRSSGQPVKRWCEEHHICVKTYYRWERLCIAQVTSQSAENIVTGSLVRIEPTTLPLREQTSSPLQNVVIRSGHVSIELAAGTCTEQIVQLVKALNHA